MFSEGAIVNLWPTNKVYGLWALEIFAPFPLNDTYGNKKCNTTVLSVELQINDNNYF